MIHKIKQKLKEDIKSIKENPKQLLWYIIPILITITLVLPVPYYITIGGGTLSLNNKISIEGTKKEGSFNLAYVSEIKGNVLYCLLGHIIPSYEIEKQEDVVPTNESVEDYEFRERISFESSIKEATFVAYKKANKKIIESSKDLVVIYIEENAKTTLKVQDKLLKIENQKINSTTELSNILNKYSVKDKVNITVLRNKKEIETTTEIIEINNEKKLGIVVFEDISYDTNPKITYNFKKRETGPSGGLTIALDIYNHLVEEDITKGYKIVGTGTIDKNGLVGEIGGVKYKLQGAVKDNADIFIVPKENYEEAITEKNKHNYKINIISVSTFDEAIEKLKNLK